MPGHTGYSGWDWLAVAQHHGLATRLLDWTYHPLAAFFFAASGAEDRECAVFAFRDPPIVDVDAISPEDFAGVGRVKPSGITARIVHQAGLFTVHGPPSLDLESYYESARPLASDASLEKIVIDESYTTELLFELNHYGYNRQTLFPDLDGLSAHVNWAVGNMSYWNTILNVDDS